MGIVNLEATIDLALLLLIWLVLAPLSLNQDFADAKLFAVCVTYSQSLVHYH